jgi:hypothetical protein
MARTERRRAGRLTAAAGCWAASFGARTTAVRCLTLATRGQGRLTYLPLAIVQAASLSCASMLLSQDDYRHADHYHWYPLYSRQQGWRRDGSTSLLGEVLPLLAVAAPRGCALRNTVPCRPLDKGQRPRLSSSRRTR